MDGNALARQVKSVALLHGQFEHTIEHGGHPLAVRDLVFFDRLQCLNRVKAWHYHNRAAETQRGG